LNADGSDQVGLASSVQALGTQEHHRRTPLAAHGKVCVEIVVQRHTHPVVVTSQFQNMNVLGPFESDFGDMNRVQTMPAKDLSRTRSESLVQ